MKGRGGSLMKFSVPSSQHQTGSAHLHASLLFTLTLITAVAAAAPARGAAPINDELRRSAVVQTVERVAPAVVGVYTETVEATSPFGSPGVDPFFQEFFGPFFGGEDRSAPRRQRTSLGSGVIVKSSGIVVTNEHVIVGGDTIRVQLADNREFDAHLIGGDSDFDLAVLKIDDKAALPTIAIGSDDSILIGETVIAIGNPYGLDHTVTTGVISALGRSLKTGDVVYQDFIQTDASINPGNSGGPLLDINGRLIGINTAIHRDAQGIGFAIPIWRVRNVVDQILTHGSVLPSWVGLQVQDVTPEIASHFDVKPGAGVVVRNIEEGSPAAGAGIAVGDIVTRVQGEQVGNTAAYQLRIGGLAVGEKLKLAVLRDGSERLIELTVAALPASVVDSYAWKSIGVEVGEAGRPAAIVVKNVRAGSPAAGIGLAPGDILAAIGGHELEGMDSYRKRLAATRGSANVLLSVVRGRRLYRVVVPLGRAPRQEE